MVLKTDTVKKSVLVLVLSFIQFRPILAGFGTFYRIELVPSTVLDWTDQSNLVFKTMVSTLPKNVFSKERSPPSSCWSCRPHHLLHTGDRISYERRKGEEGGRTPSIGVNNFSDCLTTKVWAPNSRKLLKLYYGNWQLWCKDKEFRS